MFIHKQAALKAAKLSFHPAYFHPRRAIFHAAFAPLYFAVQAVDGVGRWLDEKMHPEFKETDIQPPIFIMASPRSGTTFLHRLMSLDPQFTSYTLWQTLFPTLLAYGFVDAIGSVDKKIGSPLDKLQQALANHWFRGWDGIHETKFNSAEEDEGTFFLQWATPSVWTGWPFVEELEEEIAYVDRLPIRSKLVESFRGTLQRHMWHAQRDGQSKTLLAKNVFLAGRLGIVTDAVPDTRFVQIVRHPYETVGSMMSFFTVPWKYHSPDVPIDGRQSKAFSRIAMDYTRTVHRFMQTLPPERGITIMYTDLIDHPEREIRKIYDQFNLELSDAFGTKLHEALSHHRNYKSVHNYRLEDYGLSEDIVYEELKEIFDAYDLPRHPAS